MEIFVNIIYRIYKKVSRKLIRLRNEKYSNLGVGVNIRGKLNSDHLDHIYIGEHSFVSYDCYFHFGDQLKSDTRIILGERVFLGPRVFITTATHKISESSQRASGETVCKSVKIGDGSWIGANVTILPGVEIGKGVVVAAGSVVTKNIPDNVLYAGVPATFKKNLD